MPFVLALDDGHRQRAQSAPVDCRDPQAGWSGGCPNRGGGDHQPYETGHPVAPAIVWQCRRTASYCACHGCHQRIAHHAHESGDRGVGRRTTAHLRPIAGIASDQQAALACQA
ncbi:MAG TPA: hypothetical protein VMR62_26865 [Bryobacteraceae bacterium]|nr:hypothetical protein [Bryobacteraceae bacterium]